MYSSGQPEVMMSKSLLTTDFTKSMQRERADRLQLPLRDAIHKLTDKGIASDTFELEARPPRLATSEHLYSTPPHGTLRRYATAS